MQDSVSKRRGNRDVVDVRSWVRMMARDIAQWIRSLQQNLGQIASGGGESCWSGIGILMESNVNVANRFQDIELHPAIVVILHFENDLIPERTEPVLQFR